MKELLQEFKEAIESMFFTIFHHEVTVKTWALVIVAILIFVFGMFAMAFDMPNTKKEDIVQADTTSYIEVSTEATTTKAIVSETSDSLVESTIPETTSQIEIPDTYWGDIELIALLTMAEAEGECEEGKRLVIDTILNRVDSGYWPDTVSGVIYQANQFSPMWNGRINKCYVSEEYCQLVREEMNNRTNSEVVYFRTGHYSEYGQPMFQVGNHYFSSYD